MKMRSEPLNSLTIRLVVADRTRLELATSAVTGRRSNQTELPVHRTMGILTGLMKFAEISFNFFKLELRELCKELL